MVTIPDGQSPRSIGALLSLALDEANEYASHLSALRQEVAHIERRVGRVHDHGVKSQRAIREVVDEIHWRAIRGEKAAA